MDLYGGDIFVVWKWEWRDDYSAEDVQVEEEDIGENGRDNSSDDADHGTSEIDTIVEHSVVFKCIGASRDLISQEILSMASRKLNTNKTVEVRLALEETNPKNLIKYLIHWSRSGPGWYAGINIIKKGEWPTCVMLSRSVRFV